jgi:Amt family ammonium transporter
MLAGLVSVTAPAAFIEGWAALIIGAIGGVLVVASVLFVERKLKVDDPVGAISVHGACGIWGVLSLGIFADGTYGIGWNGVGADAVRGVTGLLYGDGGQLLAQIIGAITVIVFVFPVTYLFFKLLDKTIGMRVSPEVELEGLDLPEIGNLAYPEFAPAALDSANGYGRRAEQ